MAVMVSPRTVVEIPVSRAIFSTELTTNKPPLIIPTMRIRKRKRRYGERRSLLVDLNLLESSFFLPRTPNSYSTKLMMMEIIMRKDPATYLTG